MSLNADRSSSHRQPNRRSRSGATAAARTIGCELAELDLVSVAVGDSGGSGRTPASRRLGFRAIERRPCITLTPSWFKRFNHRLGVGIAVPAVGCRLPGGCSTLDLDEDVDRSCGDE